VYIPNKNVSKNYRVSYYLLLTYSQHFNLINDVFSFNVYFGLSVLANAGGVTFLDAVNDYKLGVNLSLADSP